MGRRRDAEEETEGMRREADALEVRTRCMVNDYDERRGFGPVLRYRRGLRQSDGKLDMNLEMKIISCQKLCFIDFPEISAALRFSGD